MTSVLLTLGRCIRRKLELTAALIQEATHVLSSHPSLVAAALGILLGLLVLFALFGTSIVLLMATGSWQLEGGSSESSGSGGGGSGGSCVFVLPPASQAGLGLSAAALLWSTMLAFTLRYFTVSFVTACWYFSPGDDLALGASSEGSGEIERGPGEVRGEVPGNPTRRGLALGLSSSFGTLCYAALVLSVCEMLNALARKSMRSRNLVLVVAGCCLRAPEPATLRAQAASACTQPATVRVQAAALRAQAATPCAQVTSSHSSSSSTSSPSRITP